MADVQHIFTGVVAPTTAPTGVGHHYIDTVLETVYISVGVSSSADWIDVSGGGGGGGASEQTISYVSNEATIDGDAGTVNIDYNESNDASATLTVDLPVGSTTAYKVININHMAVDGSGSGPSSINFTTSDPNANITVDASLDTSTYPHWLVVASWSDGYSSNGEWLVTLTDQYGSYGGGG